MSKAEELLQQAVRVGAALPFNMYSKNGMLLLGRGRYVLTEEQRQRLLAHVDADKTLHRPPPRRESPEVNPLEELVHMSQQLDYLLRHALRLPAFARDIAAMVQRLTLLCEKLPDAMIAAILLAPLPRYTAGHSVHTAILLALIARRLNTPPAERDSLLAAALTMNLAVVPLMDEMHEQSTPPSPEQREALQSHPLLSSAILRSIGVQDELWHSLIQTHHERWDGSGYPYRLKRDEIPSLAHLLHLADITLAKLTPRRYRSGLLPQHALRQLFEDRELRHDPQYIALLVKELGIYPPGSFVRLANGEIGVVIARRAKANTPYVAALRKESGAAYASPLLRETRQPQYEVTGSVGAASAGVRLAYLAQLWKARLE